MDISNDIAELESYIDSFVLSDNDKTQKETEKPTDLVRSQSATTPLENEKLKSIQNNLNSSQSASQQDLLSDKTDVKNENLVRQNNKRSSFKNKNTNKQQQPNTTKENNKNNKKSLSSIEAQRQNPQHVDNWWTEQHRFKDEHLDGIHKNVNVESVSDGLKIINSGSIIADGNIIQLETSNQSTVSSNSNSSNSTIGKTPKRVSFGETKVQEFSKFAKYRNKQKQKALAAAAQQANLTSNQLANPHFYNNMNNNKRVHNKNNDGNYKFQKSKSDNEQPQNNKPLLNTKVDKLEKAPPLVRRGSMRNSYRKNKRNQDNKNNNKNNASKNKDQKRNNSGEKTKNGKVQVKNENRKIIAHHAVSDIKTHLLGTAANTSIKETNSQNNTTIPTNPKTSTSDSLMAPNCDPKLLATIFINRAQKSPSKSSEFANLCKNLSEKIDELLPALMTQLQNQYKSRAELELERFCGFAYFLFDFWNILRKIYSESNLMQLHLPIITLLQELLDIPCAEKDYFSKFSTILPNLPKDFVESSPLLTKLRQRILKSSIQSDAENLGGQNYLQSLEFYITNFNRISDTNSFYNSNGSMQV